MSQIEVGLSMLFCLGEPFPSLIKRLHRVDVQYVEIVDDCVHALNYRRVKILRKLGETLGVRFTLHAPFADINIASPNPSLRRFILRRLKRSILYAQQLGCQLWVFHPGLRTGVSFFYPGLDWRLNLDSVKELLEFAELHGVEIAIENVPEPFPFLMKSVQDFMRFYGDLGGKESVGLAFDIGHANLKHQIQEFINRFSNRIVHIHVSDNDGVHDSHLGIGYGTINWGEVAKAIRKIGYKGIIMLESVEHVGESLQTLKKLFG